MWTVYEVTNQEVINHINSDIVAPSIDGYVYYIYSKSELPPIVKSMVIDTFMQVSQEQIDKMFEKSKKINNFKVGDNVYIKGFSKIPFTIEKVNGEEVYLVYKNRNHTFNLNMLKSHIISKVPEEEYIYTDRGELNIPIKSIIVDSSYIKHLIGDLTHYKIINFLIRLKFYIPYVSIFFTDTNDKVINDLCKLFGIKFTSIAKRAEYYFTNKVINNFSAKKVIMNNSGDLLMFPINKTTIVMEHFSNKNMLSNNTKFEILHNNKYTLLDNKYRDDLVDVKVTEDKVTSYIPDVDIEYVKNTLIKAKWYWYVENYDYYNNHLFGGIK